MQVILDNVMAKVYVCDADTYEILYANKRLKARYESDNLEGRKCWQVLSPFDGPCPYCKIPEILQKPFDQPLHWEHYNSLHHAWFKASSVLTEWPGQRRAHIVTLSDISDLKQNENRLQTFMANMSHEIRTPMNAIVGFLDLLNNEGGQLDKSTREEFMGIITDNADQLLRLISTLLDISKLDAGQMKLNLFRNDLNMLMDNIHKSFSASQMLNGKPVDFILTKPGHEAPTEFLLDYTRLRQILDNLIGNALKFTDSGYVKYGYDMVPGGLRFHVEDTGIGIAEEKLNGLGKAFNQLHNPALASKYGGTGIGVAISKSLIELMGGKLEVTSRLGEGTTFSFTIPYKE